MTPKRVLALDLDGVLHPNTTPLAEAELLICPLGTHGGWTMSTAGYGLTAEQLNALAKAHAQHPATIEAQRDAYRSALRVIVVTEYEGQHEPIWHRIAREALGE